MALKEAVEEGHIVKPQTQRNLLYLQVRDLQLRLGIGDNCLDDTIV